MNAKLLFAATVAVSLASTLALADDSSTQPVSRAQVRAELQQAIQTGTLRRTDYDDYNDANVAASTRTRAQVEAEVAAARSAPRLLGSLANRSYNPYGTELMRAPTVTRAAVKNDVLQAVADGTLIRTDYQYDHAFPTRAVGQRADTSRSFLARLFKPAHAKVGDDS